MPAEASAGGASGHPAGAVGRYLATERCNICEAHPGTTIYICAIQYKPLAARISFCLMCTMPFGAGFRGDSEIMGN
ncbi:hypothetical protein PCAR4_360038 [Paraburkholderia caribensis]|nr:hypothetical protein PCAR4_360038 [Paraburkholderia caribensis]